MVRPRALTKSGWILPPEKFWCAEGAEAIVQLRADHLSDDAPLDGFWERRQANATGQRPYRRAA